MNILKNLLFLFLASTLLFNCTKENCEPYEQNEIQIDTSFSIGNSADNMIITTLDTFLVIKAEWHEYEEFIIDINNDGQNDFKLISNHPSSPAGIDYQESWLKILNSSIEVSSEMIIDTIYKCNLNDTINEYALFNKNSGYFCEDVITKHKTDSIIYPVVYNSGDTISDNELWVQDELVFSYYNRNCCFWKPTYINQGIWNDINIKYILFRFKHDGGNSYGWIKLNIEDFKEIKLYEYAYQEFK